jgi:hypothetical protein
LRWDTFSKYEPRRERSRVGEERNRCGEEAEQEGQKISRDQQERNGFYFVDMYTFGIVAP